MTILLVSKPRFRVHDGAYRWCSRVVSGDIVDTNSGVDRSGRTSLLGVQNMVIYTDGACSGNPGPGGWAWAIAPDGEPCGSGGEEHTTNQRMEIHAVLDALRTYSAVADDQGAPMPIEIVSDSTYVVNCFRDKWWVKWERNGWKNSKKQPVANVDLWKPLIELVVAGDVGFRWVKGHSGDRMNDLVDELAVKAVPERS
jgi:ribonuclease HI